MTEHTVTLENNISEVTIETTAEQGGEALKPSESAQEPAKEPESGTGTTDDKQPDKTQEPPKAEDKKPKWAERRINQLTAEKHEERRQKEAALALLAEQNKSAGEESQNKPLTQADITALAKQEAAKMLQQQSFNQACDAAYYAGNKEYTDFNEKVGTLSALGALTPQFLSVVTESENSHKVLYHLGANPEEAERILSLPLTKQARELAKIETNLSKPATPAKPISNAPDPITPVGGNSAGSGSKDPANMSDEEYMAWRKTWHKPNR